MPATPLSKDDVAEILEEIALLLELKGANPFKIRAYTNAARAVETHPGDLAQLAREHRLEEISGVGKSIAGGVESLLLEGELQLHQELLREFPPSIFELFELQGLGPKKIKLLHDQLGISSVAELETAIQWKRLDGLPGFGSKTVANILGAIGQRKKHSGSFRLGDAAGDAEQILEDLRALPQVIRASAAGSYRRRKEVVNDLDFLASSRQPEQVMQAFITHPLVADVLQKGSTKGSVRLESGIQADLRVVADDEFACALDYFTGSKEHNIVMRQRALKRGWTLNEYRLTAVDEDAKAPPVVRSEEELYQALDLPFIVPELRENLGEFAAAEEDSLPKLIELENLRGTFHCHTTASDGRSSLQEMVEEARSLGMEYLGIADHSRSSVQAHGLAADQLLQQRRAIMELNARYDGIHVFSGVECDILKGGRLDYPDEVLGQLDYVVASVHSLFKLPEAEQTARIIRAISNPHVTMLGHLTGRMLLIRDGYAVDVPAIIEAAAGTGTIIELNCNPRRLEMDWRWWPLAREKGVRCAINPDAHHASDLHYLWFGIAAARKGWLTRDDVINTLPLKKVRAELEKKRAARG